MALSNLLSKSLKVIKFTKIRNFQIIITFDLDEPEYRYRYEKASKDLGECVFGDHWYPRPLPAGPGHNIHKTAQMNFAKISKKSIFLFFQYCSEVAGNVIYGRKSAFEAPESVRKR